MTTYTPNHILGSLSDDLSQSQPVTDFNVKHPTSSLYLNEQTPQQHDYNYTTHLKLHELTKRVDELYSLVSQIKKNEIVTIQDDQED